MKKSLQIILAVVIWLAILPGHSQGQLLDKLAIRSGTNVSFLTNSPGENAMVKYNVGMYYRKNITSNITLIPELSLLARGVDFGTLFVQPTFAGLLTADASIDILSIDTPVLVRYTFGRPDRGWMLSSGPNVSFVINSDMNVKISDQNQNITQTDDISDITNTTTFGWVWDAGYKIRAFGGGFIIGARFKKDFSAQFDDSDGAKNNVFSALLSFEF